MSKEPKVASAPWADISARLDAYESRARLHRNLSYGLFLAGMILGIVAVLQSSPLAPIPLLGAVVARIWFALYTSRASPRCPGCDAALGWDLRGSPGRTIRVRRELSCPSCGIPFVGQPEAAGAPPEGEKPA